MSTVFGFAGALVVIITVLLIIQGLHRHAACRMIASLRADHARIMTLCETFRRDHARVTIRFTRGGVNADALEFLGIVFEAAARREQIAYDQFDRDVLTPAAESPWYVRIDSDRLELAKRYMDSMAFYLGAFAVMAPDLIAAVGKTEVDGDERFLHTVLATFLRGARDFRPDIFEEALTEHAYRKANMVFLPASLEAYTGEPS